MEPTGAQRRRALRVLHPDLQVKLPLYLLGVTAAFLGALTVMAYVGLMTPFSAAVQEVSPEMAYVMNLLLEDFAVMIAVTALLYGSVVLGLCMTYSQRFLGPMVAFRRHVEALKNGDFAARVNLRRRDAHQDVALALNELTALLESEGKSLSE